MNYLGDYFLSHEQPQTYISYIKAILFLDYAYRDALKLKESNQSLIRKRMGM